MAILINRFEGGEVDFLSARDLADNQFQTFKNMRGVQLSRAVASLGKISKSDNITSSRMLPGQGFLEYRAEWDNSATPRQSSSLYYVLASIVDSVGAWEINIQRAIALPGSTASWDTEFIDETAAKGGWERATSSRLVQGATDITFAVVGGTAGLRARISGHANLENYEVGEILRVFNTTNNNGYFTVFAKAPAASSVDVMSLDAALTDEANVSAYIYPLPDISMFAIRGDMRLSNGNFYDGHASLWHGHIKRDFWGQGITYGSNGGRFEQPVMTEAYNNWKLQNQELVAPTIIAGARTGQATSVANQIAIHIAGAHHEFVELMPNSIDRTFAGGGTAWANVDLNAFNETTDLTIAASVAAQYCTCPVASMPMTAGRKYKLQFDGANLISTFTIRDFTGVQKFGTVRANGKKQSIKFTVDTGITGGLRLVADTDDASADFDNWSLSSIDWPEKAVDAEWNERDRVAFTYVYDFVQESELSRASNGEIGLPMGTVIDEEMARAFMVEVYTGAAQASWNRRITAIRLYYLFHDDPDWYEVVTLDINKGWSESVLVFAAENTGYWIPIVDGNGMDHTGTTDAAGGSGTTVESDAHGVLATDVLYVGNTITIEPDSLITKPASVVTNTITLPVAMVDSLGVNPADYNSLDWCAGDESATAVGTFYIPFTGEKAFSYFTNTGRAAKLKVPALRWRAADTDGSRVLYGNIDTKDENDQTIRERSRVIETQPGMPDTALLSMSKDVGLFSGDEIKAIKYYNGLWWVMLERGTIVLRPGTLREVARYPGIGTKWGNAHVATPYGLCMADEGGIIVLPSNEELTINKRITYQRLTLFEPALGYSRRERALYFIPDTREEAQKEMWVYHFDIKAWSKQGETAGTILYEYSNFVSVGSPHMASIGWEAFNEPESASWNETNKRITLTQINNYGASHVGDKDIKTKEYDNGVLHKEKKFGKGDVSYLGNSLIIEVYRDGEALPYKTLRPSAHPAMATEQVDVNTQCRRITFEFKAVGAFEMEDFYIPDEEITVIDR